MNIRKTFLIFSFLFPTLLFAQTSETEPNDICGDIGEITISDFGTYTGILDDHSGPDYTDYWKIQDGSSGTVKFDLFLTFGENSYYNILGYQNPNCGGSVEETYTVSDGLSQTVTLNPSYHYYIVVYANDFDGAEYEIELTDMGGVLPVELTTFTLNLIDNTVVLKWETATEVNNYGFEVERQYQGIRNKKQETRSNDEDWEKIGFVEGYGNSNSPKLYSFTDQSIESSGQYLYRLKQIDIDGAFEYSNKVEVDIGYPNNYELKQNYPNPFNPSTTITYSIPNDGQVTLSIYDVLGNEVALLENGNKSAGNYSYNFDASNFSSGLYFYTIKSGQFIETKKMLLVK